MAAETRAQAISRLKAQFPVLEDYIDGEHVSLDATAYNQRIGDWADAQIAQQQATDADTQQQALSETIQQFHNDVAAAHTELAITVTNTNAVARLAATRTVVDGLVTYLDRLVTYLGRRGVL